MLPSQNSHKFVVVTALMRSVSSTDQISATITNKKKHKSHDTLAKLTNTSRGKGQSLFTESITEWQRIRVFAKSGANTIWKFYYSEPKQPAYEH